MLVKPPLFQSKKELFFALVVVCMIAFISLSIEYHRFQTFIKTPLHVSKATVLHHYQKTNEKGKTYDVLKLRLDSAEVLYTISWKPLSLETDSRVKIKFELQELGFMEYLKGFFVRSVFVYGIYEDDPPFNRQELFSWVEQQHADEAMAELYNALFFAKPLSKSIRDGVQIWGVSHLVAISGFHLGVISLLLFALLKPLYGWFQCRYFPYRNALADITPVVMLCLGVYAYVIDFTPSFLRAFAMMVVGFFFFSRGIALLRFETLAITLLTLLAFVPTLLFSLSFWLSVAGVFYIFLFLHHFKTLPSWVIFMGLNVWVYACMIPIVHTFFPLFTPLQLLSPLLSIVFIVFYPLSALLHFIGQGDILDTFLLEGLHVSVQSVDISVSWIHMGFYVLMSVVAIRFKTVALACPFVGVVLLLT